VGIVTQASSPTLVEVTSLAARVGSRWIVRDVSFQARAGEVTAVIGPNGAGKTTLLEVMTGLRQADAGEVRVDGRPLRRFTDYARVFSFLPDAGVLPPEATVRTLVDHANRLASHRLPLDRLRAGLTVDPLLSKAAATLSRGEHQRVALYCTLALGRPVVVLDEPFAAFDPWQLRSVLAVVREVAGASTAIVASIHQLTDADKIADRILLLAEGKPLAFGDLTELRARAGSSSASLEDVFISLLSRTAHAT
jgi:ABC-2 type transport system ATP-binding protein